MSAEEKTRISPDPNYVSRDGYDPKFLGSDFRIEIPWLADEIFTDVAWNNIAARQRHVFPYHHFSLVMNRKRRLAYFTAGNIDGDAEVDIPRQGFSDKWFLDPRLPEDEQVEIELYESNPLDRGHLVRRLDPTWGSSFEDAERAHDDTFHWTNCSPQHQNFNRNRSTWAGVEHHILHSANLMNHRVSVFTGPVFRHDDPVYITSDDEPIQIPRDFWKVVAAIKQPGQLSATAYLISQKELIDQMLATESVFNPKTFQIPVSTVEVSTKLSFRGLAEFDALASDTTESVSIQSRELQSIDDVIW
ncbi:MAG: DNA/RNA non-specific endonuclease [Gammaproteobacteria bacterium]|nr:DNA/RNA non-specific endonuclease [Gammaproteobacteria bacterium]